MTTGYQIADCTGAAIDDSGSNVVVTNAALAEALRSTKPIYISNITATVSGVSTQRSGWGSVQDTGHTNGQTVSIIQKDLRLTFSVLDDTVTISYHALEL